MKILPDKDQSVTDKDTKPVTWPAVAIALILCSTLVAIVWIITEAVS